MPNYLRRIQRVCGVCAEALPGELHNTCNCFRTRKVGKCWEQCPSKEVMQWIDIGMGNEPTHPPSGEGGSFLSFAPKIEENPPPGSIHWANPHYPPGAFAQTHQSVPRIPNLKKNMCKVVMSGKCHQKKLFACSVCFDHFIRVRSSKKNGNLIAESWTQLGNTSGPFRKT